MTPLWLLVHPSVLSLQSYCSRRKLKISSLFSKALIYSTYMQWVDFLLFSSNYCHNLCHIPVMWYFGLVLFLSFTHCIPVVQHSSLSCKTTKDATQICWFWSNISESFDSDTQFTVFQPHFYTYQSLRHAGSSYQHQGSRKIFGTVVSFFLLKRTPLNVGELNIVKCLSEPM
jgi:hypothetical protein